MKNVLKGGLRSLIPNRDLKDADDVLDELEEDEEQEQPASSGGTKVRIVSEDPEIKLKKRKKKEVVVQEDEDQTESEVEDEEVEEVEEAAEPSEAEAPAPSKPLVTPLEIDNGDEPPIELKKRRKVTAAQVSQKTQVKRAKKVRKEPKKEPKVVVEADEEVEVEAESKSGEMWDKHEGEVQHIVISSIRINPNQPRRKFDKKEMEDLTSSIEQHGILQPLVIRRMKSGYELVAGERRLRAAKSLEWERVPCVVRRDVTSGASRLELALVENIQREDLNPIEEAMAYKQLNEEYGMTHEEIGERVGRSRVGITNIIRVLQLPEEIQQGLTNGIITSGHAKAILMIPDEEKQLRFYRHLVEEGLTVRKAETRARRIQRTMNLDDPMRHKRKGRNAFELKYSGLLEDRFGYDAGLKFNEVKNRFEVLFKCFSKEEIDELLGRLLGEAPLANKQDKDVIEDEE